MNRYMLRLAWLLALAPTTLAAQEPGSSPGTTTPVSVQAAPVVPATTTTTPVDVPSRADPADTPATVTVVGWQGSPVAQTPPGVAVLVEPIPPAAVTQGALARPLVNAPAVLTPSYTAPTRPVSAPPPPR
jgi:hypothetical protein